MLSTQDCDDTLQENEKEAVQEKSVSGDDGEKKDEHQKTLTISKTQMKKLAKRQRYLETRPAKRKLEREKRKFKKRAEAQEREKAGIIELPMNKRFSLMSESDNKFGVIIDMDFENYMTDNEISKATKQLGRIYSLNRRSKSPCQLYFTSLSGKIKERMESSHNGHKKWDVYQNEENYLKVFESIDKNAIKNFIYLSGDAEETLPNVEELLKNESQIFIIGGLVDHNRHKNLCHNRATELNIKTAKLPIKEYITLSQRHILSTVTVFEILSHVLGSKRSWEEAFKLSIPKRKIKT